MGLSFPNIINTRITPAELLDYSNALPFVVHSSGSNKKGMDN